MEGGRAAVALVLLGLVGGASAFVAPPPPQPAPRGPAAAAAARGASRCWGVGNRRGLVLLAAEGGSSASSAGAEEAEDDQAVKLPQLEVPDLPSDLERQAIWGEIEDMEAALERATEDGEKEALEARLRELRAKDPYFALKQNFDAASERGDFFTAAKLRLILDKVGIPTGQRQTDKILPKLPTEPTQAGGSKPGDGEENEGESSRRKSLRFSPQCTTTTDGVTVEVKSQYYPEQSNPSNNQYVFTYTVTIRNDSDKTMQLASRTWKIKSAILEEPEQIVRGPGVVGQQPVLEPGDSFEYTSVCPIRCNPNSGHPRVVGRMQGSYLMVSGDRGEFGFEALIDPFFLILPPGVREGGRDDGDNSSLIEALGL